MSSEHGNAKAQCEMGDSYRLGLGVPENGEEAVKWYRKSAEQGWKLASNQLGLCYPKNGS